MTLPTVADLRPQLNKTSTADDDELEAMLDAAIEVVENMIGPLSVDDVTETHRGVRSDVLVLQRMPAGGLVSVSSRVGSTVTTLTVGDYEVDTASGLVRRVDGGAFSGDYVVTYSAGNATVSAGVRLAILIIAAHLWDTQRGATPTPYQEAEDPLVFAGRPSFAIPNRAKELLAPYLQGPVVA